MPKTPTVAAPQQILLQLCRSRFTIAKSDRVFTDMKRTALRSLTLFAIVAAVTGCQAGPRFAWWKHDKTPEDSSAVARSAKPTLPSAQSKPEAVAIAGLTPATPPSSSNLAAAASPAGGNGCHARRSIGVDSRDVRRDVGQRAIRDLSDRQSGRQAGHDPQREIGNSKLANSGGHGSTENGC